MISDIILLVGIVVMFYMSYELKKELNNDYLSDKGKRSPWATGPFFWIALFFPKPFFKNETFWKGYGLYLLHFLYMACVVYLIIQSLK
nr:hypothetical protein [Nanoarchaeum sp.]